MSFAAAERRRLAQILHEVGPDQPTLCEEWLTRDLAAHLWVRERRMDAIAGMFLPFLEAHLQSTMDGVKDRDYDEVVEEWASGPPTLSPFKLIDAQANAAEHFIHLEDVRRGRAAHGGEVPPPRDFSEHINEKLFSAATMFAKMTLRGSQTPTILLPDGARPVTIRGGQAVAHKGDQVVRVAGQAGEILLWAAGRSACHVTVSGDVDSLKRSGI
ncbi:TIGR03085 family metal-binding protein [Corynebacterium renale]|uniref:TIGR03085 family metal-binding protein n=1 Tax=Corynebacterium renale TaxID=1724 RepID=UPI000E1BDC20|nr:TIGR03085 family metal-binding protein [Corynebacterium renale]